MFNRLILAICATSLIVLTACGSDQSTSVTSGTPDQDPIVAKYRSLFQSSWGPTWGDLALGSVWTCHYRYAYRNNFGEGSNLSYVFASRGRFVQNHGSAAPKTLVIGPTGMAANVQNYGFVMRITEEGTLIGEWSAPAMLFPSTYSVPSVADPRRRAYAYEECRLSDGHAPAPAPEPGPFNPVGG